MTHDWHVTIDDDADLGFALACLISRAISASEFREWVHTVSEEMADALVVNPFDADEIADAMHLALAMPLRERQARHASLLAVIRASSAAAFCRTFIAALEAVPSDRS